MTVTKRYLQDNAFIGVFEEICEEHQMILHNQYKQPISGHTFEIGFDIFRPAQTGDHAFHYTADNYHVIYGVKYWPEMGLVQVWSKQDSLVVNICEPNSLDNIIKYLKDEIPGSHPNNVPESDMFQEQE